MPYGAWSALSASSVLKAFSSRCLCDLLVMEIIELIRIVYGELTWTARGHAFGWAHLPFLCLAGMLFRGEAGDDMTALSVLTQ